jgi:4-diphosphocytidyl-2-C-methyl-D-erythritol kinase
VEQAPALDNDLEPVSFGMVPRLRQIKERLLASGAAGASMSGSGSAVFGLYTDRGGLDQLVSEMASAGACAFACRTLSREAYHLNLFERSQDDM